jgi:hypothetical protein
MDEPAERMQQKADEVQQHELGKLESPTNEEAHIDEAKIPDIAKEADESITEEGSQDDNE